MDISARPLTLDFEGPEGEVFLRQAMIRYTLSIAKNWKLAIAAESSGGEFVIPAGLTGAEKSEIPDIPGYVRYEGCHGHIQVAGIARQIRFAGSQGSPSVSKGTFGLNATFVWKTVGKDTLSAQFVVGDGLTKHIEALNGQNADAVCCLTAPWKSLQHSQDSLDTPTIGSQTFDPEFHTSLPISIATRISLARSFGGCRIFA